MAEPTSLVTTSVTADVQLAVVEPSAAGANGTAATGDGMDASSNRRGPQRRSDNVVMDASSNSRGPQRRGANVVMADSSSRSETESTRIAGNPPFSFVTAANREPSLPLTTLTAPVSAPVRPGAYSASGSGATGKGMRSRSPPPSPALNNKASVIPTAALSSPGAFSASGNGATGKVMRSRSPPRSPASKNKASFIPTAALSSPGAYSASGTGGKGLSRPSPVTGRASSGPSPGAYSASGSGAVEKGQQRGLQGKRDGALPGPPPLTARTSSGPSPGAYSASGSGAVEKGLQRGLQGKRDGALPGPPPLTSSVGAPVYHHSSGTTGEGQGDVVSVVSRPPTLTERASSCPGAYSATGTDTAETRKAARGLRNTQSIGEGSSHSQDKCALSPARTVTKGRRGLGKWKDGAGTNDQEADDLNESQSGVSYGGLEDSANSNMDAVRFLPRKVHDQLIAASVTVQVPKSAGLRKNIAPAKTDKMGERVIPKTHAVSEVAKPGVEYFGGDNNNNSDDYDVAKGLNPRIPPRHSDSYDLLVHLVTSGAIALNQQSKTASVNAQDFRCWREEQKVLEFDQAHGDHDGTDALTQKSASYEMLAHLVKDGTIQISSHDGTIALLKDHGHGNDDPQGTRNDGLPSSPENSYEMLMELLQGDKMDARPLNGSSQLGREHPDSDLYMPASCSGNAAAGYNSLPPPGSRSLSIQSHDDVSMTPNQLSQTNSYQPVERVVDGGFGSSGLFVESVTGPRPSKIENVPVPHDEEQGPSTMDTPYGVKPSDKEAGSSKKRLYMALAALLVVVIVVVVVVVVVAGGNDSGSAESPVAETGEANGDVQQQVDDPKLDFDASILPLLPDITVQAIQQDIQSPQAMAFAWFAEDSNWSTHEEWKKLQRFAMATFYYSFGGSSWPTDNDQAKNWLRVDLDECEWLPYNNSCNEKGEVLLLNITRLSGFKGAIPPELVLLQSLEEVDLSDNRPGSDSSLLFPLSGSEVSLPSSLKKIWCSRCALGGTIPTQMFQVTQLERILLNGNRLSGSLPSEIGLLTALQFLIMMENSITGSLPTEIGMMTTLRDLGLDSNDIAGTIPDEIGSLQNLWWFGLAANALTSSIPSSIALMSSLRFLDVGKNKLSGTVPTELGLLPHLQRLAMMRNGFSGPLPSELGQLSALWHLSMFYNSLTSTLPTELGKLSEIKTISLWSNQFTGGLPSELGLLTSMQMLATKNNDLNITVPSEVQALPNYNLFEL